MLELIFLKLLPFCFSNHLIAIQSPFGILPISCASFSKIAAQGARGGKWGQRVVQRERVQKWEPIISALRTSDYIIPPLSSLETVAGKAYWGARMMTTGWAKGG